MQKDEPPFSQNANLIVQKSYGANGNFKPVPFSSTYQPANAGRKPGSKSASTVLRELLDEDAPGEIMDQAFIKQYAKCLNGKKPTIKDALAARVAYNAITKGDHKMAALMFDRADGKAAQTIEVKADPDQVRNEVKGQMAALFGDSLVFEAFFDEEGDVVDGEIVESDVE